jgi:flagellar L-ring protein FlgH
MNRSRVAPSPRATLAALLLGFSWLALAATAEAQNNSLAAAAGDDLLGGSPEATNWIYVPVPPPREINVHDIVFVQVNELSQMTAEGEIQRRKNALYDAILNDWVLLNAFRSIKPSPQEDGDPRVQGRLTQLYRAEGDLETREQLTLKIAAKVVDKRPNGNLVLEAHKEVRANNETWQVSLTGICRADDFAENGMILSDRIYDLKIWKRDRGHVRDSYRRGWFVWLLDTLAPW